MLELEKRKTIRRPAHVSINTDETIVLIVPIANLAIKIFINGPMGFIEYSIICSNGAGEALVKERGLYGHNHDLYLKNLIRIAEEYLHTHYEKFDIKIDIGPIVYYGINNHGIRKKSLESLWMFIVNQGIIK
jgi:hypothetical protein